MKIAVVSDTHVPHKFETISQRMKEGLTGVDLILHCGDIVTPDVLSEIASFAPVYAVAGNHDLEFFGDTLPRKRVIEVAGYRIGMIHGDELDGNHVKKSEQYGLIYEIVIKPFLFENPLDCIVFGHSHQPLIQSFPVVFKPSHGRRIKQDVLVFNPGTPVRNRRLSTMGYLYLENDVFKTEIKVFTYPCLKVQE
ncbi:MAG: metallophosphoesterase family protein [Bacillota bacterium]|nr:metallophosphoesterase family protein [Clostridia bacterium]